MRKSKNKFSQAQLTVSFKPSCHPVKIMDKQDAESFLYSIWDKELINVQEQLYALYLNQNNEVICWRCLHTGTITSSVLDLRLLFGFGLSCCAVAILIAHNHPSGKLKPSQADLIFTNKVAEAGALLEIALLDHLILGNGKSMSFREDRLI